MASLEAGEVVLVKSDSGQYAGLLGIVETPPHDHRVGVWFRQSGAPPAEYAVLDLDSLVAVGAMPGAEPAGRVANAIRGERNRTLAIARLVRAQFPTCAQACDEISDMITRGEVERDEVAPLPVRGGLRTTQAEATDQVFENGFATGVRSERARILAIVAEIRAEAVSHASGAWGSGSEGPENAGRWKACDAIAAKVLSP